MTKKELQEKLKEFSTEDLKWEVSRRCKRRVGKVLGYRAICRGDEYHYGSYSDYIIGKGWCKTKKDAKELAERALSRSENGGYIQTIYKDTPKPDKIH